jgi:hypothetical protein
MHIWSRKVIPALLATAISCPVLLTGCAVQGRVYDDYDQQYVRWHAEAPYYSQWEQETHRRHERFERRNREEQREYWEWRDHHGDRDDSGR